MACSEKLRAGMEDVMRNETKGKAGLKAGWLMRCAMHMLGDVAQFQAEAGAIGESLEHSIFQKVAEAK